jgi:hypothetical protein
MLLGAAVSGGTAALSGERDIKDLLKSAVIGAATGYIGGGGISNLLSGNPLANIAGTEGIGALANVAPQAVQSGIPSVIQGTEMAGAAAPLAGTGSAAPSVATNIMGGDPLALAKLSADVGPQAMTGSVNPLISQAASPASTFSTALADAGPTGVSSFMEGAGAGASSGPSLLKDPFGYMANNKALTGTAAIAGMMSGQQNPEPPKRRKIEGLPIWAMQYNQGGIASLARGGMPGYDMVVGETPMYARGGVSDLGTYSDGGRMLKGRGDGMSDSIPGVIAGKRPARLADGEFVVPADVVSHLGNGSTDAGAKQLYAMMNKVRQARTGTKKQGRQINPRRFMPA